MAKSPKVTANLPADGHDDVGLGPGAGHASTSPSTWAPSDTVRSRTVDAPLRLS